MSHPMPGMDTETLETMACADPSPWGGCFLETPSPHLLHGPPVPHAAWEEGGVTVRSLPASLTLRDVWKPPGMAR